MKNIKTLKAFSALVAVIGLAYGCLCVYAGEEDKELKKFEGVWTVIRAEQSGKQLPDDDLKTMSATFKDGVMTIKKGDRMEICDVTVDSTTMPKSIDFRPQKFKNGQVDRGIYQFNDEELTLCWGGEMPPGSRTREFKSTTKGLQRLLVLKRSKAKE